MPSPTCLCTVALVGLGASASGPPELIARTARAMASGAAKIAMVMTLRLVVTWLSLRSRAPVPAPGSMSE